MMVGYFTMRFPLHLPNTRTSLVVVTDLVVFLFASGAIAAKAQTNATIAKPPDGLIYSLKGPDLFRAYCATCHGSEGKGDGPTAPALKAKVPDLTQLARNNGGPFDAGRVRKIIAGDELVIAHGSREMPIWGLIFHQVEEDQDFGAVRLENLVKYVESIQSLEPSNSASSPSGTELYQQNCAACHGSDLKGGDRVPSPYRTPPDLTTLAKRQGGQFPEDYVFSVLENGVVIPAHGPAEMPVWSAAFRSGDQLSERQIKQRISNLTNYIKAHQAK